MMLRRVSHLSISMAHQYPIQMKWRFVQCAQLVMMTLTCNAAQPYTLLWHCMHFCSTQLYCDFILQHIVILSRNN